MGLQEWGYNSSNDRVLACMHGSLSACDWMPVLALQSRWSLQLNYIERVMVYNGSFL